MGQYVPGFVAAYNSYASNELGVAIDDTYQAIAFRAVNAPWDYGRGPGGGADKNFATDLAVAMRRNPQLRLMVGTGYYDLVTTLGSAGIHRRTRGYSVGGHAVSICIPPGTCLIWAPRRVRRWLEMFGRSWLERRID